MEIELTGCEDLYTVLKRASEKANAHSEPVSFVFNEISHEVFPLESEDSWRARASERAGFEVLTPEESRKQLTADMERRKKKEAAAIAGAGVPTEKELRVSGVPTPDSEQELIEYIHSLVERPHDYGTCVYAMSMAATAAFNYVAHKLGVTGFQASCADMDIIKRTRHMEHGFRIVDYANLFYPQYWDDEQRPIFQAYIRENRAKVAAEACKLLADNTAVDTVRDHWKTLVGDTPEGEKT